MEEEEEEEFKLKATSQEVFIQLFSSDRTTTGSDKSSIEIYADHQP